MARRKQIEDETVGTDTTEAKASTGRADIASINRTSDVAQADYVYTIMVYGDEEHKEQLKDIVDEGTLDAIQAASWIGR